MQKDVFHRVERSRKRVLRGKRVGEGEDVRTRGAAKPSAQRIVCVEVSGDKAAAV
jgi:hypothetical protein